MRVVVGGLERLAALLLLFAIGPALLVLSVTIWLLSGRAPLVAIHRVGRYGRPLRMLKFRTMWPPQRGPRRLKLIEEIHECALPLRKNGFDTRVSSPFAGFCRRYSLDELPQLWHVVTGDMSFVGPRPLTAPELKAYYGPEAAVVLQVKPGLTGLWQTRGRNRLSYQQRKRLDLFLARHNTGRLRAAILLRTLPCVLRGKDAW